MLEIYLLSTVACFILMGISIKLLDGSVTGRDLFFNFITSCTPLINIVILVCMLFAIISRFWDKEVF